MTDFPTIYNVMLEVRDDMLTNPMFQTALDINSGYCAVFIKKVLPKLEGVDIDTPIDIIVSQDFELADELSEFETIETDNEDCVSHCYIHIDGSYYDAQDPEGVESEYDMEFHNNPLYL